MPAASSRECSRVQTNRGSTLRSNTRTRAMSSNKNLSDTIKHVLSDESDVRDATAPYQAEFPYERDEEAQVTRREFCNFLGLTSAALFVGAAGFAAKAALDARESVSLPAAPIGGAETLAPNSSLNLSYPTARDSAILIRIANGAYHAY